MRQWIKAVVYILLSAEAPVLLYYILLSAATHFFNNIKKLFFKHLHTCHINQGDCLQINLNWVWPRHQFSYWVCSLSSLINLTTYEPNSESDFVVATKNWFLISHNNHQPRLRCMIRPSVKFRKLLYISCFCVNINSIHKTNDITNRCMENEPGSNARTSANSCPWYMSVMY